MVSTLKTNTMAKPKSVVAAMSSLDYKLKNIYSKGSKKIRLDFEPRYGNSGNKHFSMWVDRDYFARNWPRNYNRF
jgi:hypothetical protein